MGRSTWSTPEKGQEVTPRLSRTGSYWPPPRGGPRFEWDSAIPTHRVARVGTDNEAAPVSGGLGLNYDVLLGTRILGRRLPKLVDLFSEEVLAPASCSAHVVGVSRELQRVWTVCLGKDREPENQALPLSWVDMEGESSTLRR